MKAKVGRGNGFRGVLDYALGKNKGGAEIVGGTISSGTPRQLAQEFGLVRRLRPDAKNPVWHCSLSLPKGDHLTSEKWDAIASDFIQEMGFSELTPWVAIRHSDTDHDHIHIVASRIGLDGALWHGKWEARTAIEATQKLEEIHGLTLTPGLNGVDENWQKTSRIRGRKTLKKGEIEMSLRTGEQPPKLKLQNVIDESLSAGNLTAVKFAETLAIAGVQVRANLASTGRFNGFSYQVDGVAFKGSSLGKAYSWGGLQKRGVTYEQARDYQELTRFASIGTDQSDKRTIDESGSDRPDSNSVRQNQPSSTPEPASLGGRNQYESNGSTTAAIDDANKQNHDFRADFGEGGKISRIYGESSKFDTQISMENTRISKPIETPALAKTDGFGGDNSTTSKPTNSSWNARFKAASAKKRDTITADNGQSNTTRNRVAEQDIQSARHLDPRRFLEQLGYTVKRDGKKHFSVLIGKDEAYRLTQKADGKWLWVDNYGNNGGDNIDLVKELTGLSGFADRVYELAGAPSAIYAPIKPPPAPQPPRIPPESQQGRMLGRIYLEERGISSETTLHAEKTGFLRYLSDGLLFVGYQAGKAWNATKRAFDPDAEVKKRDFAGSDKSKPQILDGNSQSIWIVEGGIDALAVQDIAKRQGKTPPTAIVSGGSGVKSFLENPEIMEKIRAARLVVVAGENEKNADVQAKTDAQHEAQLELVKALNPSAQAVIWKPESRMGSDIADYNLNMQNQNKGQKEGGITQEVKPRDFNM